mmetsp:Transcript_5640/g.14525  ORF Transcript_5640/g.14525 Transcript_5640/m.14525 type:complete len:215 (-) Transcript_5640:291-935(-)
MISKSIRVDSVGKEFGVGDEAIRGRQRRLEINHLQSCFHAIRDNPVGNASTFFAKSRSHNKFVSIARNCHRLVDRGNDTQEDITTIVRARQFPNEGAEVTFERSMSHSRIHRLVGTERNDGGVPLWNARQRLPERLIRLQSRRRLRPTSQIVDDCLGGIDRKLGEPRSEQGRMVVQGIQFARRRRTGARSMIFARQQNGQLRRIRRSEAPVLGI